MSYSRLCSSEYAGTPSDVVGGGSYSGGFRQVCPSRPSRPSHCLTLTAAATYVCIPYVASRHRLSAVKSQMTAAAPRTFLLGIPTSDAFHYI